MLYRAPRFSLATLLRAVLATIAGALAEFHRTGVDTAYLDSLPEHHLHDLGVHRFTDRGETFYR